MQLLEVPGIMVELACVADVVRAVLQHDCLGAALPKRKGRLEAVVPLYRLLVVPRVALVAEGCLETKICHLFVPFSGCNSQGFKGSPKVINLLRVLIRKRDIFWLNVGGGTFGVILG